MAFPQKEQDQQAVLDWTFNWSSWLGTDTIAESSWTIPTGLTKVLDLVVDPARVKTTVWVKGGTVGSKYTLVNHVKTNSTPPREDDRTFILKIVER